MGNSKSSPKSDSYAMKLPLEQLLRYKVLGYLGADGQPLHDCQFIAMHSYTHTCKCHCDGCKRDRVRMGHCVSMEVAQTFTATLLVVDGSAEGAKVVTGGPGSSIEIAGGPTWVKVSDPATIPLAELLQHCTNGEVVLCSKGTSGSNHDLGMMMPQFLPVAPTTGLVDFTGQFVAEQFASDHSTNCHFLVEEKRFHAHREILMKSGNYFDAMFTRDWEEKETGEIKIVDFNADEVEAFVKVLYCSAKICDYLLKDTGLFFSIYKLANKYNVVRILELCKRAFSYVKIDQDSICDAIKVARDKEQKTLWFNCSVAARYLPADFWTSDSYLGFLASNPDVAGEFMKEFVVSSVAKPTSQ